MGKLQGTYKAKKYVKMRLYQRYHYYKLTVDIYIILYVGPRDVTESAGTIRSPFCGHIAI